MHTERTKERETFQEDGKGLKSEENKDGVTSVLVEKDTSAGMRGVMGMVVPAIDFDVITGIIRILLKTKAPYQRVSQVMKQDTRFLCHRFFENEYISLLEKVRR